MTTILDRRIFLVLLTAAIVCTVVAVSGVHYDYVPTAKWLNTASGLYGLSAIFQARASGWFERLLEKYGDGEKFPYGPPSHITREVIESPDTPIRTSLRNTLFAEPGTAIILAILSVVIAIIAEWI